jgi:pyruvate formate lyase activating enzyme
MARISRRQFLGAAALCAACGAGAAARLLDQRWWEWEGTAGGPRPTPAPPTQWSVEAAYYSPVLEEGTLNCVACHSETEEPLPVAYCHTPHTGTTVRCNLCPHRCFVAEGERGHCRTRENRGGRLFSLVYGNPCAIHVDPIEKKPLYHFLPTAPALSLATAGCNLRCLYCQNWTISQVAPDEIEHDDLPPEAAVIYAHMSNAPVIAYTYSEPTVFYEYMLATAQLARRAGLLSVVISAGFINPDPLRELCANVDAIKIDLKGYDEEFYREVCGGELAPVLEAIRTIHASGTHLEIVNLVVPTLNDDLEQLRALAQWVARDVSPDVPLHFSRFHPQYRLTNLPPTPVETLERAREIALEEGVRFVYLGNVPGHPGNNTTCPTCGEVLVAREGFAVSEYHLRAGTCAFCGEPIPGVWWPGEPEGEPVQVPPGQPDQ